MSGPSRPTVPPAPGDVPEREALAETATGVEEVVVPITFELSPIRQLLIIDVADDPTYCTLEPQVLETPDGAGTLLLAYRHDGHVEVYAPPELDVDASGYEGLGNGLEELHRATFEHGRFEVTGDGLQLDVAFTAPTGRRFDLHLHEHLGGRRDRVALLAPVGGAFDKPAFFPFLWLPAMSFVPARGTDIDLRVDGEARSIAHLPLPIGGRRCLMARYDAEVLVCLLNPAGVQAPARARVNGAEAPAAPDLEVAAVGDGQAIAAVRVARGGHTCAARFEPPLPDPRSVPVGARRAGDLLLQADGRTQLRGRYELTRAGDLVELVIDDFGPWRTRVRRPLFALLFRLPIFRRWPTTYHWRGSLDLAAGRDGRLDSRWVRRTT
jgi:hypothetical protein